MGENTNIVWCHKTWNPWRGCTKVSPGCDHCYAETLAKRNPGLLGTWGPAGKRVVAGRKYLDDPYRWDANAKKMGKRFRVFCGSMMDILEDRPELAGIRSDVWRTARETPNLDWMFLTKRPENFQKLIVGAVHENMWFGVTIENKSVCDRLEHLLHIPCGLRFISVEPMLGPVDLRLFSEIGWVIVGCESGPHARPCNLQWVRDVVAQCKMVNVPVLVKQLNDWRGVKCPNNKNFVCHHVEHWPSDLRIQEFPRV